MISKNGKKILNEKTQGYININMTNKYKFQQFKTKRAFGENIYAGKSSIDETGKDQNNLLENMVEFNNKSRINS